MQQSIICKICSNGCKVSAKQKEGSFFITGNRCKKGWKLLQGKILKENPTARFTKNGKESLSLPQKPAKLLSFWDIAFSKEIPEVMLQGSPERSLFRTVVEDIHGTRFILEEIAKKETAQKENIARRLAKLQNRNLKTISYLQGSSGDYVQKRKGRYWLCQAYLKNETLSRSTYWQSTEKGKEVAQFLIDLREASSDFKKRKSDKFSLIVYIEKLCKTIKKKNSETYASLKPVLNIVEEHLYPAYLKLPESFSHGDPHPLNMIWQDEHIVAVIDWEFSGFKPRLYDVSLILGCVGSEAEDALNGEFIQAFLTTLLEQKYLQKREWRLLPLFVVAQRFAWLSEWLRRDDHEMVDFELYYMRHLLQWKPHQIIEAQQLSTD